jgi:hypothetical protein
MPGLVPLGNNTDETFKDSQARECPERILCQQALIHPCQNALRILPLNTERIYDSGVQII